MLKFNELEFNRVDEDHIHALQFFENGYGVSVVRFPGSYGYDKGLYELAVLKGTVNDYDLCYDTPITDDVIGHLNESSIENIIKEVESL